MTQIDRPVLFFDCWYTLFESDMADDLKRIAELLKVPFGRPLVKSFETAFMTSRGLDQKIWSRRLLKQLGLPVKSAQVEAIIQIIEAGFDRQRPYPDTLEALDRLAHSHQLAMITNTSQAAFEHLDAAYGLSERFDSITASYEVGVIKPDTRIFRMALERAGVSASQAIMIGDNPLDDIEGARTAGFARAILIDRRNRFPQFEGRLKDLYQISTLDA